MEGGGGGGGGERQGAKGGGWEGWKQRRLAAKDIDGWGSGREANKEAMKEANSEVYPFLFSLFVFFFF